MRSWPVSDAGAIRCGAARFETRLSLVHLTLKILYAFVLYDYETESLWCHLPGEEDLTCISGPYADRKLPELSSVFTRWNNWKADFPDTKILTLG